MQLFMKLDRVGPLFLLLISLLLLSATCDGENSFSDGQEYKGKVVGIADGDTFTMLTAENKQIKVRLSEIDTPERAQPYGSRARQALSDLVFNKEVVVMEDDTDRYGRLVGQVYVGDLHVNRKMVQDGMAWVYWQYLKDENLLDDEEAARLAKRGLWSLPSTEQVPPWEWRRGNRTSPSARAKPAPTKDSQSKDAKDFRCGSKTKCSEMISCEEALYYLEECGLSRLDGNGDGVPCESLCK